MTGVEMSPPRATHAALPSARAGKGYAVRDAFTMMWRNLLNIRRNPELLVFATIQPVIFVLMFRYVFGGAIEGSLPAGQSYINFLMPGIFVQTIVFGALTTGVGLAEDLHTGLIDRFRSLPMARSAVLTGRTGADLVRNFFVMVLVVVVGFMVGWTIETDAWGLVAAVLLILAFSYALSWVFAIVGLTARNSETAQAISFPIIAPLVFASSAFVPVSTMPSWLQGWAENQPVSVVIDAARELTLTGDARDEVLKALAWIVAIVAVCVPIAVARYRRAT
jgi:ABC-2 type transport system permease protein/oleandomycin transport system permease protein